MNYDKRFKIEEENFKIKDNSTGHCAMKDVESQVKYIEDISVVVEYVVKSEMNKNHITIEEHNCGVPDSIPERQI